MKTTLHIGDAKVTLRRWDGAAMNLVHQQLPLPMGVVRADYWRDMREVVTYDIHLDRYPVRYDWIGEDGKKQTFIPDAIEETTTFGKYDLIGALAVRRIACLKHRGIE